MGGGCQISRKKRSIALHWPVLLPSPSLSNDDTFDDMCTAVLFPPPATEDLLASLQHIQSRLTSIDDQKQIAQLTPLFHNRAFRHALQAHNKIVAFSLRSPRPTAAGDATSLNEQVVARTTTSESPLARELTQLLQSPHLKVISQSKPFCAIIFATKMSHYFCIDWTRQIIRIVHYCL